MAAIDSVVEIDLIVRIGRIGSGPFEESLVVVVAIPDFACYLQDRVCYAVANTRGLPSVWQDNVESLGRALRLGSSP